MFTWTITLPGGQTRTVQSHRMGVGDGTLVLMNLTKPPMGTPDSYIWLSYAPGQWLKCEQTGPAVA